jgi:2,3-dihydroxybiphenyl 1,2-dioxygenase
VTCVAALAYIGLTATNVKEWSDFAARLLGAEVSLAADGSAACRIDSRAFRIGLEQGGENDLAYVGWEVADEAVLDQIRRRLEAAGYYPRPMTESEAKDRRVAAGVVAQDPNGLTLEVVVEPAVGGEPFVSPLGVSFVTEELGLGHVVLYVKDLQESLSFYCNVLGFAVTDRIHLGGIQVVFLHCNGRHHSLALVPGRTSQRLQHFMLEVDSIDVVGRAFDRCEAEQRAQSTLGRHTNDFMFSFYAQPPECTYTIEYGHGGRVLSDPVTVVSFDSTSWWGHKDLLPGQL